MKRFAFLGAGNMAYAIVGGMNNSNVIIFDKFPSQYDKFESSVIRAETASEAVSQADYVVLSVKPQNFPELLAELRASGISLDGKTFISIAAGVSCASVCRGLGKDVPVIRTMPNTPLLIGKGVTALSRNQLVSDEAFSEIFSAFSALGFAFELPEDKMNAIIAATSSAPAYVFSFIDAICKEAAREGIDTPELLKAVCAMVIGSAEMLSRTDKTPEELIRMVTSPKGTTERAMNVFSERKLDETVALAMQACTLRAEELSQNY